MPDEIYEVPFFLSSHLTLSTTRALFSASWFVYLFPSVKFKSVSFQLTLFSLSRHLVPPNDPYLHLSLVKNLFERSFYTGNQGFCHRSSTLFIATDTLFGTRELKTKLLCIGTDSWCTILGCWCSLGSLNKSFLGLQNWRGKDKLVTSTVDAFKQTPMSHSSNRCKSTSLPSGPRASLHNKQVKGSPNKLNININHLTTITRSMQHLRLSLHLDLRVRRQAFHSETKALLAQNIYQQTNYMCRNWV